MSNTNVIRYDFAHQHTGEPRVVFFDFEQVENGSMYDIVETIENTGYLFQKSAACTGCVDANGNEIYVDSKIYLSGTNHLYEVEFAGGTKYWIFNEDVPKSDLAACSHLFEVAPTDYLQFDD